MFLEVDMLTKEQRFEGSRTNKQRKSERVYLENALRMSHYVESIAQLDILNADLVNAESPKYKEFSKKRAMSTLLYAKLSMGEAVERYQFYNNAADEKRYISDIDAILTRVYDDYSKSHADIALNVLRNKTDPQKDIDELLNTINLLVDLYPKSQDLAHARSLCYSLYFMLLMMNIGLANLKSMQKRALNKIGIGDSETNRIRGDLAPLLEKTKSKVIEIEAELAKNKELSQSNENKTIQDHFNTRYFKVLHDNPLLDKKFKILIDTMDEVTRFLPDLIENRKKKEELESKIRSVMALQDALVENEELVSGRLYSLELIEKNKACFEVLIASTSGKNQHVIDQLNAIKSPSAIENIVTSSLYVMSSASTVLTLPYRYVTPLKMQGLVSAALPTTRDSDFKIQLNQLASDCLKELHEQVDQKNQQIGSLVSQLANQQNDLIPLIANESVSELEQLLLANKEAKKTAIAFQKLMVSVKTKSSSLQQMKHFSRTLDIFITSHDGFWVKLSNFFAQFLSIFKSSTAEMIDKSREMQEELSSKVNALEEEIKHGTQTIETNSLISTEVTKGLKDEFYNELGAPSHSAIQLKPNKTDIQWMIKERERLFNLCRNNPEEEEVPDNSGSGLII